MQENAADGSPAGSSVAARVVQISYRVDDVDDADPPRSVGEASFPMSATHRHPPSENPGVCSMRVTYFRNLGFVYVRGDADLARRAVHGGDGCYR